MTTSPSQPGTPRWRTPRNAPSASPPQSRTPLRAVRPSSPRPGTEARGRPRRQPVTHQLPMLPRSDPDGDPGQGTELEAGRAIAEPLLEHIELEERPDRPQHQVAPAVRSSGTGELLGLEAGVLVDLPEEDLHGGDG